jgi:complement component 1 Q subcomponent-binding protein
MRSKNTIGRSFFIDANLRSIRVTFSIADLNNIDPDSDYEDRALDDEEEGSEDTINEGQNKDLKAAPEENAGEDAKDQGSFPARVYVVIEKPKKGALAIEAFAQDGMIDIHQVFYHPDASYASDKLAQVIHERQEMYTGPPFSNLDEDLQLLFDKYLDERGINTALALFVPDYIDLKEQKEYARWLSKMRDFIDA